MDTRYVEIHVEGQRLPHAVVRVTGTVEEAFTHDLVWAPSDLLSRVPDEPGWTAYESDAERATDEMAQMAITIRWALYNSELAEIKYYAVFNDTTHVIDLDKASMLIRRTEEYRHESYGGPNLWWRTYKLDRLDREQGMFEEYVPISAAEAEHLTRMSDRKQAENYRCYLVTEEGGPSAVVRVPKTPDVRGRELAFTGETRWHDSDLSSTARDIQEITWERGLEYMAELSQRWRDAHNTDGHAVFHKLTDVLDLDAAYAVVQELGPEHRFSVRLDSYETEGLAARVLLRNAKRNAEPVDGHYYLAMFLSTKDMLDLGQARSVFRCTTDGREWEVFLREQEWPPSMKPLLGHVLPIGPAEVAQVTRRLSANGIRYFEIRGPSGPIALTRLTGDTEATETPGGWKPSDLLRRWRHEPTWRIVDETQTRKDGTGLWHRNLIAVMRRRTT